MFLVGETPTAVSYLSRTTRALSIMSGPGLHPSLPWRQTCVMTVQNKTSTSPAGARGGEPEMDTYSPHEIISVWYHSQTCVSFLIPAGIKKMNNQKKYLLRSVCCFNCCRGLTAVSVKSLTTWGGVTRLSYTVESGGIGPWGGTKTAMLHEAGQFVFINVRRKKKHTSYGK